MWGGAAVLRASGALLVAGGPTRGLTEQVPARVGASRLVLWGEPGGPIDAEKIAVVLFKLDTGARGPWLLVRRGRVPSRFSVPHHIQAEVPETPKCPAGTAAANRS